MDFTFPNGVCDRRRYKTGNDKPISANTNAGQFYLESGNKQLMGGRIYVCSFYAYVRATVDAANLWVFLFDVSNNTSIQDFPNPTVALRIPGTARTIGYEPSDAEIDEVVLSDGKTVAKVGAFFENGVRLVVSSTELTLTPVDDWGYVMKADFVTMKANPCGPGLV